MKSIEFVGPSSIGKSTFLRNLIKYRENSSWITDKEFLKQIPSTDLNFKEKVARKALKSLDLNFAYQEREDVL